MNPGLPSLDELYREVILDHYQSPRNRGRLADPDVASAGSNPLCGDEIELSLRIRDGQVADVAFEGRGCSISQASASMMTEAIKGRPLAEVREVLGAFKRLMTERDATDVDLAALGDLEALQGVRRYPVRVKCAVLPWNVLQESLDLYRAGQARARAREE
ncbi:MAG TPA: SUF system NifU family Fe-S cluster assembly protein [Chloroflexota bacterium]|jgi:nitrogen fixation NifU-like protein|nr:SUF system NifU family Fe-S cluster assembly protein [Chloroflexota bacterium]